MCHKIYNVIIYDLRKRLSLDPIDLSPFEYLMKFTQRSFPLY